MSIRYTREHHGYPGIVDMTIPMPSGTGAALLSASVVGGYDTDDNGMLCIGAVLTPSVDGIWYAFGAVDPDGVLHVGHYLPVNQQLVLHSRWETAQIKIVSDDTVDNAVVSVSYLFPKPPTFAGP